MRDNLAWTRAKVQHSHSPKCESNSAVFSRNRLKANVDVVIVEVIQNTYILAPMLLLGTGSNIYWGLNPQCDNSNSTGQKSLIHD